MATRIGFEGAFQVSTDGGTTWNTIGNVKDITLGMEMGDSDSTTRANGGYRSSEPTLMAIDPEFQMVWDTEDDDFTLFFSTFRNRQPLLCQFLDAPGGTGYRGTFKIFSFQKGEELENVQMVDVSMKLARSTTPPQYIVNGEVASSSSTSSGA